MKFYRGSTRNKQGEERVSVDQQATFAEVYKSARAKYLAALEASLTRTFKTPKAREAAAEKLKKLELKWKEALFDFDHQANQSPDAESFYRRHGIEREKG